MTDSERLDAIGEHGLCLATHDSLGHAGWERLGIVQYGEKVMMASSIREAIDGALLDLTTCGPEVH